MKRILSLLLMLVFIVFQINTSVFIANAKEYYAVYEGTLTSFSGSGKSIFTVYSLDDGSFTGHIYNSKNPKIDMNVSGDLYKYSDYYECVFSATSTYTYNIKVYPHDGRAECNVYGGVFFSSDCTMYGTVDLLYNADNHDLDDMRMCMNLA